jgi:hypothetical protein
MKSKVIYVSEEPDHLIEHSIIDIVSPKVLNALLSEGWFIKENEKKKINHPKLNRRITVQRIELSQESGLTVKGEKATQEHPAGILSELVKKNNEGMVAALSLIAKSFQQQQGPPGENASGYLGRSIAGQIPGVGIVTPLAMQAAFGSGVDAAKSGVDIDTCPFPEGSSPYYKWVDGFLNSGGKPDPEMLVAMEEGHEAATTKGKHEEVTCRWKPNTRGYVAWLYAFKKAGGVVE